MKNIFFRILDTLGWLWCIPEEQASNLTMAKFIRKKIPIFWVMGPPKCGKTTIANILAETINYDLIKCSQLIKDALEKGGYEGMVIKHLVETDNVVTDEIIINLLINVILDTFESSTGYVIDGFPIDLRQAKEFIHKFHKPSIIIFVCLTDDGIMSRMPEKDISSSQIVLTHNEWMQKLNEVYRTYERKTLKVVTNKPPNIICDYLVNYLIEHYGYNFK